MRLELDKAQQQAIAMVLSNDKEIMYISGQAGVGKSQIIKIIKKKLEHNGWIVSLTAPTGKASKKICGKTIHSWLMPIVEVDKYMNFKIIGFNKENFSNMECLIIDESSMLDSIVYSEVLRVYENTCKEFKKKIILVGDVNQLEPVGKGTPFIDFIKENPKLGIELNTIYRQKEGNDIISFASAVRKGEKCDIEKLKNVKKISHNSAINAVIKDMYNNQIICPMTKNSNGTNSLNIKIQEKKINNKEIYIRKQWVLDKNSDGKKHIQNDKSMFEGDKIIITKNNWLFNITNGTIGILEGKGKKNLDDIYDKMSKHIKINNFLKHPKKEVAVVYFIDLDTGKSEFLPLLWMELNSDLAYALTVHKFQGSQSKHIFFMNTFDQMFFINKKMYYTAITRAEEKLYIVSY